MANKKRQKSKAALATAQRRAAREQAAGVSAPTDAERPAAEPAYRGGVLSGMRSGFKNIAGTGEVEKKKGGALNTILWIAVIAAAVFFFAGQFR